MQYRSAVAVRHSKSPPGAMSGTVYPASTVNSAPAASTSTTWQWSSTASSGCSRAATCAETIRNGPAKAGDWVAARKEQERLCRLFEMVWVAMARVSAGSAGVGSFKTAMQQLGIIDTNIMARPQRRLDAAETAKIVEMVRAAGLMS